MLRKMTAERAKEIQGSTLWKDLVAEMDIRIAYETSKLRSCTPEELQLIQARIDIFETVTRLPDDVIDRES